MHDMRGASKFFRRGGGVRLFEFARRGGGEGQVHIFGNSFVGQIHACSNHDVMWGHNRGVPLFINF